MAAIEQRYASALAALVGAGKADADRLLGELDEVGDMLQTSPPLRGVLASPAVGFEKKRAVIEALAKRAGLSPIARNLMLVTAQRGRAAYWTGITRALRQLLLAQRGIVQTEIVSARDLTAAERQAIETRLAAAVGHTLQAEYRRDDNLLGGFVARVGDRIFDASLRGRLQRLRQALTSA